MNKLLSYIKRKTIEYTSLKTRMQTLLAEYNNKTFTSYKPYIISLKSKEILDYLNNYKQHTLEKINHWSDFNDTLLSITKACYHRFNPTMIYAFNDEIHMVFYNTSDYNDLYNGNIHKIMTTITSFVTQLFTKKFIHMGFNFEFTFHAKCIEFLTEYETLNYLVWRQHDCRRNNIITLYKCIDSNIVDMTLEDVTQNLFHHIKELHINPDNLNFIIYGNIIKKELVYIDNTHYKILYNNNQFNTPLNKKEETLITRKEFNVSHHLLHTQFKENLHKYIYNTYL